MNGPQLIRTETAFLQAGFEGLQQSLFLLRPEFRLRYGIPTVQGGFFSKLPGLREVFVMGAYYLLRKQGPA